MRTVSKWRNSLVLRIPAIFAAMEGPDERNEVDPKTSAGSLIVKAVRRKSALKQLVAQITPGNRHCEVDLQGPVGKEWW